METTATASTPTASPQTGRFGREPQPNVPLTEAAAPPAGAPAPSPGLAATRAIARRWPRTVPPKRVFPRH
jgi:hypothetical protein